MLKVNNISFGYTSKEVLKNISFQANKGDYIAIVGESGCGKSTLLEIIYGLLHIDKGTVYWNEKKLLGPNFYLIPGEDFMKYLPQDFDLMPYTTVEDNIGKNLSYLDEHRNQRIAELLDVVDMVEFLKTKVKNLSGGQKQRVAIAKVLAKEPEVLLLDEPFSHIDNFRKNKLRRSLFKYLKSKNILCLVATHDTTDALSFADKIIVLKDTKIETIGTPEEVYNNPTSSYVASFFNEINEIPLAAIDKNSTSKATKLVYPNQLTVVPKSSIKATVLHSYFKGSFYLIESNLNGTTLFFEHTEQLQTGASIFLKIH
ncbi:ABC-type Fe3+/spermidine/putrescine transport systems, ATPase components [Lutibacter agarilyticus]|uniref:ABC-type Fe3+/spermidine/putrescine transport systems, ATPase components n=1 Tax=Lutibacter agarilyticus TaxID=1109740 RepID=A0A238W1Y1_9FLAO|nr:ABC transporter ATP-binding protein [Lutibacter agarilyticus]SNR40562.1 ABC-type Fe3+/spermidine/putrescine transport systems, ATPase components [Lutibacter agarilyticus]